MPAKPLDIEALFHAARRIGAKEERERFIEQACGDDLARAARVRVLLKMHEEESADDASGPAPTVDTDRVAEGVGSMVGPYRLKELIGEGGFGLVFVAEQTEPVRRKVALKVIKPGMDTRQVIARFEAERQALAMMDHPNIAKVLDAGTTGSGLPYFVMELVRGIPITDYCDLNHLTPADRLGLFVSVCHAIQHAHQKGVIHRDVKPSNVLVTNHDGKPVAKVIDFGVAKAVHRPLTDRSVYTSFAQMIGTPLYMSPEQAEMSGLDVDTRSDVYSLGVLLYELLTGSTPLERNQLATAAYDEVRRLIREEEPQRPSQRLSTSAKLPTVAANRKTEPVKLSRLMKGDLDWIVMKALEKDRTRRYETANGFAMDVERYLSGEPVLAAPPSAAYRARKFVAKHRTGLSTAAMLFLLLAVGAGVSTWQAVRATHAERAARIAAEEAETARRDEAERAEGERKAKQQALAAAVAEAVARKEAYEAVAEVTNGAVVQLIGRSVKLTELQRAFLDNLVARYERLAAALPAAADADKTRAQFLVNVGHTKLALGDFVGAKAAYQRAAALFKQEAEAAPNDLDAALRWVRATHSAGVAAERLGVRDEVTAANAQAIAATEGILRKEPNHVLALGLLAILYSNRCKVGDHAGPASRIDDATKGIVAAERALALRPKGVGEPELGDPYIGLVACLQERARQYSFEGDIDRARQDVARLASLVLDRRDVNLSQVLIAAWTDLSWALGRAGKHEEALATVRKAVELAERLVAQYPGYELARLALLQADRMHAEQLRGAGRSEEAERIARRAAELGDREAADGSRGWPVHGERVWASILETQSLRDIGRRAEAVERLAATTRRMNEYLALAPSASPAGRDDAKHQLRAGREVAGLAESLEQWPEAIELNRTLLKRLQQERGRGRPDADLDDFSCRSALGLAAALTRAGRLDEAAAAWREAVLAAAWLAAGPVDGCEQIAEVATRLRAAGKSADLAAVVAPGFADRDAKLRADPHDKAVRHELRRAYRVVGLAFEKGRDFAASLAAYDKGLALGDPPPRDSDANLCLLMRLGRVVCLDGLGRDHEADAAVADYVKRYPAAFDPWFRLMMLVRHGRIDRGLQQTAERLMTETEGIDFYNGACVYAVASAELKESDARRGQCTVKAIELLRRAKGAGYFDNADRRSEVKSDKDLDALRGRDDFKTLLAELDDPNKPTVGRTP